MKLCSIFVGKYGGNGIWSIQLHGEVQNEFDRFFGRIRDAGWLYQFFEEHQADLESGYFEADIDEAVSITLNDVEDMENALFRYAEKGFAGKEFCLQHLFKPLNNFEYTMLPLQFSKVRIHRSWLRVYAIRLGENCYLITGGAIKLSRYMNRRHLQDELRKLEMTKRFLRINGIEFSEDLNSYFDE